MPKEPTVGLLLNRFRNEIKTVLYPFLILSIIQRRGSASRQQIREEISQLTGGTIELETAAHNRLIGRLKKTFGLIEPLGKSQDADAVQYGLTSKGKKLYADALHQVIYPLGDILPLD